LSGSGPARRVCQKFFQKTPPKVLTRRVMSLYFAQVFLLLDSTTLLDSTINEAQKEVIMRSIKNSRPADDVVVLDIPET
jgi:hypothetical protein